jgi:hypothetical protein
MEENHMWKIIMADEAWVYELTPESKPNSMT